MSSLSEAVSIVRQAMKMHAEHFNDPHFTNSADPESYFNLNVFMASDADVLCGYMDEFLTREQYGQLCVVFASIAGSMLSQYKKIRPTLVDMKLVKPSKRQHVQQKNILTKKRVRKQRKYFIEEFGGKGNTRV